MDAILMLWKHNVILNRNITDTKDKVMQNLAGVFIEVTLNCVPLGYHKEPYDQRYV